MPQKMSETDIQIAFSEIRLQIMAIATRHPEEIQTMVSIGGILAKLQLVCRPIEDRPESAERKPETQPQPKGRPAAYGRRKLYYRVMSVRGLCLAEDWKEAKQPYYVPLPIYQQAAEVLSDCTKHEPAPFDTLAEALDKLMPGVSDYMLRTCLRFWRQADPPLVEMAHRRYSAVSPESFRQATMALWERTPTLQA